MSLEKVCALAGKCKLAGTAQCNITCYPYVVAHGSSGKGGMFGATGIPKRYRKTDLSLIKQQNPDAYGILKAYAANMKDFVEDGVGLFLFSIPNADNKMGTGTGKTTVAAHMVNTYTEMRIIEHVTGRKKIDEQPALFVRASEFQNLHKAKYSGSEEMKVEASEKFSRFKNLMMNVELLVIDDISLRNSTASFTDEMYEILDERYIEGRSTILTSNMPLEKIGEMLSEQIASRIAGMTEPIPFKGKDNRKMF